MFEDGVRDLVEFGCGYGTFTVPAARRIRGVCHGLDIDPAMIEATWCRAEQERAENVVLALRDFVDAGTGLDADSVSYVMLFNILHTEAPLGLLREAPHRRKDNKGDDCCCKPSSPCFLCVAALFVSLH